MKAYDLMVSIKIRNESPKGQTHLLEQSAAELEQFERPPHILIEEIWVYSTRAQEKRQPASKVYVDLVVFPGPVPTEAVVRVPDTVIWLTDVVREGVIESPILGVGLHSRNDLIEELTHQVLDQPGDMSVNRDEGNGLLENPLRSQVDGCTARHFGM
jgi:hypothetical protein